MRLNENVALKIAQAEKSPTNSFSAGFAQAQAIACISGKGLVTSLKTKMGI